MRLSTHIYRKIGCIIFQFIPDQASNKQGYPMFQPVMTEKRERLLAYIHNLFHRWHNILKHGRAHQAGSQAQTYICVAHYCSKIA